MSDTARATAPTAVVSSAQTANPEGSARSSRIRSDVARSCSATRTRTSLSRPVRPFGLLMRSAETAALLTVLSSLSFSTPFYVPPLPLTRIDGSVKVRRSQRGQGSEHPIAHVVLFGSLRSRFCRRVERAFAPTDLWNEAPAQGGASLVIRRCVATRETGTLDVAGPFVGCLVGRRGGFLSLRSHSSARRRAARNGEASGSC